MGSLAPKPLSKLNGEYRYISFKELQDDCFLSSLMNIKISHSHHFINFDISLNNIVERIIDDSVWLVLTNNYSWSK